jgi:hypothetical protein
MDRLLAIALSLGPDPDRLAGASAKPQDRRVAARILGQLLRRVRTARGLLQGRKAGRGVLLHRRRRRDLDAVMSASVEVGMSNGLLGVIAATARVHRCTSFRPR